MDDGCPGQPGPVTIEAQVSGTSLARRSNMMKPQEEFVVFVVSTCLTLALLFWLISAYLEPHVLAWFGFD